MTDVTVTARGAIDAVVRVPGSKSVANRALVCAMLAEGESSVSGVPDGDDTSVVVDVLRQMGLATGGDGTWKIRGDRAARLPGIVDARLAGTSSRFLTAVAALGSSSTVIDGDAPLRTRPMGDLHAALQELGASVEPLGEPGHLPVSVTRDAFAGGRIAIRGDVSSQFVSALMLVAPLLGGGLVLDITGDLVSRSYVEMTAAVMADFGASVSVGDGTITVEPGGYVARDYAVEPDFSSAAFPLVVPVFTDARIRVVGLARSRMQGDSRILGILSEIGCRVSVDGVDVVVERGPHDTLQAVSLSMTDCSDLVPAVAAALSALPGESRIAGVGFIRNKESDRIDDLAAELRTCGVSVTTDDDGLTVHGCERRGSASVDTHHDHRLAMALSLMSLGGTRVTVRDADVVSKSWPSYFDDMAGILSAERTEN